MNYICIIMIRSEKAMLNEKGYIQYNIYGTVLKIIRKILYMLFHYI